MFGIEVRDSWERQQSEERAWTPRKHSKGNWCYWGKVQIRPVFDDKGFRNSYPSNTLGNNTCCVHARFGWGLGARRRKGTVESAESMAYAKPTCSIVKGGSEIIFLILASPTWSFWKRKIGTSTENFLFLTWDSIWVVQTPSFPGFLGLKSHLRVDLLEGSSWYWSISYGGP